MPQAMGRFCRIRSWNSTLLRLLSASLQSSFVAQVVLVVIRYAVYRRALSSVVEAPPMSLGVAYTEVGLAVGQQHSKVQRSRF